MSGRWLHALLGRAPAFSPSVGLVKLPGGERRDEFRLFQGAADFDLELIETRTQDRSIQELVDRPTLHA